MTSFRELALHGRLVDYLESQDISSPTDVQNTAIPVLLAGRDALVCAETGTGKTLAYLLPVMHHLLGNPRLLSRESPHCLILLPTRELADQVYKQVLALAEASGVRAVLISGGQEFRYQASLLRRNPEFVVATPGRLTEHLARNSLDLGGVKCLVLDEADRMLDMGFREDVLAIAAHIQGEHQSVMLSATLKHKGIAVVAVDLLHEPEKVLLSTAREVNKNIKLQMILSDDTEHKIRQLTWLLANQSHAKALIFVKTRETTEQVASALRAHNHNVRFLHGEVAQDERRKIMAGFREGRFKVMVATDVAARGLDVSDLDLVINYDMAQSGEEFVHRAGRTGRAGEEGLLISLVSSPEWNLCAGIQRYLGVTFERRRIAGLEGNYKGPKKVKASGKAAGPKKKKPAASGKGGKAVKQAKGGGKGVGKGVGAGSATAGRTSSRGRAGGAQAGDKGFAPLKKPRPERQDGRG